MSYQSGWLKISEDVYETHIGAGGALGVHSCIERKKGKWYITRKDFEENKERKSYLSFHEAMKVCEPQLPVYKEEQKHPLSSSERIAQEEKNIVKKERLKVKKVKRILQKKSEAIYMAKNKLQ